MARQEHPRRHLHSVPNIPPPRTIDELVEDAVDRAVTRLLAPYLRRLAQPEPAVYTVAQAAIVLQVSDDTISRLVRRGALPRVPHLDGKVLIPRRAVETLIESSDEP